MTFCDAHLHLSQCEALPVFTSDNENSIKYFCVSSCHSKSDLESFGRLAGILPPPGFPQFRLRSIASGNGFAAAPIPDAFLSFGIHPQEFAQKLFNESDFSLLEELIASKKIAAIGEFGFDFFTPELKSTEIQQTEAFERQLSLAVKNQLPVVLHLRKAVHKVFEYSKDLSKVPSVIFHSFPGTVTEAESILNHKINVFFSFGKPLLNGRKASVQCVENLPLNRILLETDAPYQTLKNEKKTLPEEIQRVYQKAAELRKISLEELSEKLQKNFFNAFCLENIH